MDNPHAVLDLLRPWLSVNVSARPGGPNGSTLNTKLNSQVTHDASIK